MNVTTESEQEVGAELSAGFRDLGSRLGRLLTSLAGCSAIAFVMGWVYYRTYFSMFGWSWLVSEVRTGELLAAALFPAGILGVCAAISFRDATRSVDWRRQSAGEIRFFVVAFVALGIAALIAASKRYLGLAEILNGATYMPIGYVFGNLIVDLAREGTSRQPRHWVWLPLTLIMVLGAATYYLPSQAGRVAGVKALQRPERLPRVVFGDSTDQEWRRLHSVGDLFFLVRVDGGGVATQRRIVPIGDAYAELDP